MRLSGDDRVSQRISSGATLHIPLRYLINVSSAEKPMPNLSSALQKIAIQNSAPSSLRPYPPESWYNLVVLILLSIYVSDVFERFFVIIEKEGFRWNIFLLWTFMGCEL